MPPIGITNVLTRDCIRVFYDCMVTHFFITKILIFYQLFSLQDDEEDLDEAMRLNERPVEAHVHLVLK